jgi:pilus assembly protein CpaE
MIKPSGRANSTGVRAAVRPPTREFAWESGAMEPAARQGRRVVFFSLKGGVGTTTLATNVALLLAQQGGRRVALCDLALEQGQAEVLLDVMPLVDLGTLGRNRVAPGDVRPDNVNAWLTEHASGLALLAAPREPEDAERIGPELAGALLQALAGAFAYVVVDTPSAFTEPTLRALELGDRVVLVATSDLAGAKATSTTLRTFWKLQIPTERVLVVLNAPHGEGGIARDTFEQAIERSVTTTLPYDPAFGQALNRGQPYVLSQGRRSSAALAGLTALATALAGS